MATGAIELTGLTERDSQAAEGKLQVEKLFSYIATAGIVGLIVVLPGESSVK